MQICKTAYALKQVFDDSSQDFVSLDSNYWFPAGSGHKAVAIMDHKSTDVSEDLDLRMGELLSDVTNTFTGFFSGTKDKTGKRGRFPGFKVRSSVQIAPFDLFSL